MTTWISTEHKNGVARGDYGLGLDVCPLQRRRDNQQRLVADFEVVGSRRDITDQPTRVVENTNSCVA